MKYLIKKTALSVFLTFIFGMFLSAPIGLASVANAHHKPGHTCNGNNCGPAPTVDELPIKYMVPGGVALILVAGGIAYVVRSRGKKQTLKA